MLTEYSGANGGCFLQGPESGMGGVCKCVSGRDDYSKASNLGRSAKLSALDSLTKSFYVGVLRQEEDS